MEFVLNLTFGLFFVSAVFFARAVFRYYNKMPKGAQTIDIIGELRKIANVEENIIDNRKIYNIKSKNEVNDAATILYLHGGAYVGGITKRHLNVIYKILNDTKMKIILPDYPLAPKATYLQVFEWLEKLYEECQNEKNIIFMGDSAGAGMALAFAQKLSVENKKMPQKLILISPWIDITLKNEEILEKEKTDKVLNKAVLKIAADMYSGDSNQENYLMSPINGPLDKIDNISIFTGTADILNPDVHILKQKIEALEHVNLKFYEKEEAIHNWIFDDLENSKEDYQKIIDEIINFK